MASLFSEGFETSGSAFWATPNGSEETVIVHSGSKSWKFDTTSDYHAITAIGELWLSFWFYTPTLPDNSVIVRFNNTNTTHDTLRIDSSGYLQLYQGTTFLAAGTTPLSVDTWYNLKTHISISDTSGSFEAKIGSDVDISYAGDTRQGTSPTSVNRIYFGNNLSVYYYDDIDGDDAIYPNEGVGVNVSDSVSISESKTVEIEGYIAPFEISKSDSTSITESVSLEITEPPPDLSLSVSDSVGTSESYSLYNTGTLPPIAVSDTVTVSESVSRTVSVMPRIAGTINGNEIAGYVRSLRRVAHLCNPGQHATLMMSPDWPHGSLPGKMVFLYEDGIQVMKGFVIRSVRSRPSYEWMIEIDDTYTLVVSTFLDIPEATTAGHDTTYWATYILEKCGANYNINGTPAMVPEGVQIGLRPASEALKDIMAYASWYAWPDKQGVIQIGRFDRSISGRTVTEFTHFEHDLSDDMTRNVIKVYGTGRIFAVSSAFVPGIVPDRIAVVGSPLIQSNAEAQRVGDYMISEIGQLTEVIRGTIPGNPRIKVGNVVTLTHEIDGVRYSVTDTVTSLESNYDINSSYEMEVSVGERCPRIAGFSQKIPYTYAGLDGNGVYVSRDKGVTWSAMNGGLPNGKVASRVAGDSYGKAMAIVNRGLWYETGNNWEAVTLPSPGGTARAVGSLGGMDSFAVLTGSRVFFSIPSTGSNVPDDPTVSTGSLSGWTSVTMTTTDLNSGSTLYAYGYDMYTKAGTAYVNAVTSSGSDPSSGSAGGGSGGLGYFGGAMSPDYFGQHIETAKVVGTGGTFYGETALTGGGFEFTLDDTLPGNPGAGSWTLSSGASWVAYRVTTTNTYPNNSLARFYMRGTLSATGDAGCYVSLSLISNVADYYGVGTGLASPSNIGTVSTTYCPPGETVSFEIHTPSNLLSTIGWLKDAYIGFIFYDDLQLASYGAHGTYELSITQLDLQYDDGGWSIFYPASSGSFSSGSYNLYTVNAGGSILVSDIPAAANINDRLYVSDDGEVILYNTAGRLLISNNFGSTFHSAYPSAAPTKVPAVTRAQTPSTALITSGSYNTVIGAVTGTNTSGSYQAATETSGGWQATGALPATFVATDAIWSALSTQGVLMGGGGYATKIFRFDPPEAPFASPVASDSGIPSESASNVLDLEFGE